MTEPFQIPRLRYRRLFGGYRREEVLFHLRELEASVRRLEAQLLVTREQSGALTIQLDSANAELVRLRVGEAEVAQELERGRRRAQDLVEAAERQASVLLAEAAERAAQIKTNAHLQIEEIGRQLEEILRLRETMTGSLRSVVVDVGLALGRIERGEPMFGPRPEPRRPDLTPSSDSRRDPAAGQSAVNSSLEAEVFERRLEVHAGPFPDFATLSRFEGVLAGLPRIDDVYVREFEGEWAIVEVAMQSEQPFVALLREAFSSEFEAERTTAGALRLTLESVSVANAG